MDKLGLIAGGGRLPLEVAEFCRRAERPLFVVRLQGSVDQPLDRFDGLDIPVTQVGHIIDAMKKAGCKAVCLVGQVAKPDFSKIASQLDFKGVTLLPGMAAAAAKGDDALLRFFLTMLEKEGFRVEGATQVMDELAIGEGALGAHAPDEADMRDLEKALEAARIVGQFDIGQGAVVCNGVVLAVEAQEGTDAMLERIPDLPEALRGTPAERRGVLAKAPKPIQERRVDLPTIGVRTVENAAAAGLVGIAGEAHGLIVLDREAVVEVADRLGLFIWGARPGEAGGR
ncbi:MAG: UDP-2,3-diacylglucosamine diphosphatase LpxI [Caulobacteraceae bacterium]|nr:UDP-2,3-diacylglucosamine diphosphatase LpxI [Caulobacteraceae bacterium]